ncbi:MAG: hypothetical protein RL166_208 [Actinomycetota bacterium]
MKLRGISVVALLAVCASLLAAAPANAVTRNLPNANSPTNAVGLIVTYKAGVSLLAPNGEPTGENFAGVELGAPVQMGERMAAVPFENDLTDSEAREALAGIQNDPRVESAQFNEFVEMATVRSAPISSQIFPSNEPVQLPIVIRTAVKPASLAPISAQDAWLSGTTERVTVSWAKALAGYSGTVIGYRVQIYASGAWRTLKSLTSASARSYTTTTSYLKAGTQSRFRVAAITKRYSKTYVGYYKYVYVTPTTLPQVRDVLTLRNNLTQLQASWTNYATAWERGGLEVSYSVVVRKPDNSEVPCVVTSPNNCTVSNLQSGTTYTVSLVVTNARGSVSLNKNLLFNAPAPVNASANTHYSKQWYLKSSENYSAKVSEAWTTESGLDEVIVAVLDTGYTDHSDIPSSSILPGYDFISSASSANDGNGRDSDAHDAGDYSGNENSSWHGTHVAGIIAAADNAQGVVGIAPHVKILPVRVLGADGGTTADIISAIYWAAGIHRSGVADNPNKASVINMSIGGQSNGCDAGTEAALAAAKAAGITVVTAAGNDNYLASQSYPGNCYPTINIGSSGRNGTPSFYSNFSNAGTVGSNGQPFGVDLSAPGGDYCQGGSAAQIYSTLNTGTTSPGSESYAYEIGTSMASPVVAGIVALMYSAKLRQDPAMTFNGAFVESVWDALATTATPFASDSPQNCVATGQLSIRDGSAYGGYGPGIVNARAALTAILQ